MNWKSRHLSIIFIAALLYSGLVTSFYHHHDFSLHSGCGFCKFVAEVPLADNAAPQQPIGPYFISLHVFLGSTFQASVAPSTGLIARAPPA
jgi:hypothetical protein